MPDRIPLVVFRWYDKSSNERQVDLSAMRMPREHQKYPLRSIRENVGIVRKSHHRRIVRYFRQGLTEVRLSGPGIRDSKQPDMLSVPINAYSTVFNHLDSNGGQSSSNSFPIID